MCKKMYLPLLLLILFSSITHAQENSIAINSFTVKNQLPSNVNDWGNTPSALLLVAQNNSWGARPMRLLIAVKKGDNKICGIADGIDLDYFKTHSFQTNDLLAALGNYEALPPGDYTLCARFRGMSDNRQWEDISTEVCKPFTVGGGNADAQKYTRPSLISPENNKAFTEKEANAPITLRWTPVVLKPQEPVIYHIRIWQVAAGQSPIQAMTGQPVVEKEGENLTQTNITSGLFPCSPNCNFIWTVQATNKEGHPYGENASSDFSLFTIIKEKKNTPISWINTDYAVVGGGITNPIGSEMADNAFLGNGFNINEGIYFTLFGNDKISGGIVGNIDYYNLSADNGLSNLTHYKVIDGSTTGAAYNGELPRATSFDFLVGPKLSFNMNKFYITPSVLLGYQTIKRDAFTIADSVFETNNPSNKIYVPLLSSGVLKASGFAFKPKLEIGYHISPSWSVNASYGITLGPTMKNSYASFVPGGDPDSTGAYFIDQFYGGSTTTKTSDVKWQTGSFTVGISYRFWNGTPCDQQNIGSSKRNLNSAYTIASIPPKKRNNNDSAGKAPTLIEPKNNKVFTFEEAKNPITFRWTPVVPKPHEPVTYHFRVWQLLEGQSASQAMNENRPIMEYNDSTESITKNLLSRPCNPPYLCSFVWNVEAINKEGKPFGENQSRSKEGKPYGENNYRSETGTFSFH